MYKLSQSSKTAITWVLLRAFDIFEAVTATDALGTIEAVFSFLFQRK